MIHIYLIRSVDTGKLYVGITDNLERRLKEHNAGKSKYTSTFKPWVLVYSETAEGYKAARVREKYLKSTAGKKFIQKILDSK